MKFPIFIIYNSFSLKCLAGFVGSFPSNFVLMTSRYTYFWIATSGALDTSKNTIIIQVSDFKCPSTISYRVSHAPLDAEDKNLFFTQWGLQPPWSTLTNVLSEVLCDWKLWVQFRVDLFFNWNVSKLTYKEFPC